MSILKKKNSKLHFGMKFDPERKNDVCFENRVENDEDHVGGKTTGPIYLGFTSGV